MLSKLTEIPDHHSAKVFLQIHVTRRSRNLNLYENHKYILFFVEDKYHNKARLFVWDDDVSYYDKYVKPGNKYQLNNFHFNSNYKLITVNECTSIFKINKFTKFINQLAITNYYKTLKNTITTHWIKCIPNIIIHPAQASNVIDNKFYIGHQFNYRFLGKRNIFAVFDINDNSWTRLYLKRKYESFAINIFGKPFVINNINTKQLLYINTDNQLIIMDLNDYNHIQSIDLNLKISDTKIIGWIIYLNSFNEISIGITTYHKISKKNMFYNILKLHNNTMLLIHKQHLLEKTEKCLLYKYNKKIYLFSNKKLYFFCIKSQSINLIHDYIKSFCDINKICTIAYFNNLIILSHNNKSLYYIDLNNYKIFKSIIKLPITGTIASNVVNKNKQELLIEKTQISEYIFKFEKQNKILIPMEIKNLIKEFCIYPNFHVLNFKNSDHWKLNLETLILNTF